MNASALHTIWSTFRNYRKYLAVLVILGFLGAILDGVGINAAVPLLSFLLGTQAVPDDFVSQTIQGLFGLLHVPFNFRYLIVFILTLFMLRAISLIFFGYIRGWIRADFFAAESRDLQHRVLKAGWPYLLGQKMGTLQNVMVRDIQRTADLLDTTSQVIQSFSGFLMYLLVAINISPATTVITVAGGAVLLAAVQPFLTRIVRTGRQVADMEKQINKFLSEQIIGMKTLKAMGVEDAALAFGRGLVNTLRRLQVRLSFIRSLATALFQPFTVVFIAAVFAVSYSSPNFSAVAFIATLYLIQKMFTYLQSGQVSLHSLGELVPYAESVATYKVALVEHREEPRDGGKPFVFKDILTFENISLAYTPGEPAVRDINLALKRGQMLALVGPSGSGKTSLADLLLRLFEPTGGRITVDRVPAGDITLADWRAHIGYVSQDVFLFNGTVEENIRFFRDNLTQADIEAAAKQANIYDFIMSLPGGFAAHVGDRGVTLSGGQRQRIALARVLAGRPDVLVLDEATSALDTESERAIQEAIRNLHGTVAVFVIAHRLSTVEHADTIAVIEDGRITELGAPEELRKNPGSYFAKHSAG